MGVGVAAFGMVSFYKFNCTHNSLVIIHNIQSIHSISKFFSN